MNYTDPKLRSILAGEYVLGTMPPRTRARFERLMRFDAGLARLVGDWAEELGAIDATAPPATPSARVWAAIEARTKPAAATKSAAFGLSFWRGLALGSAAVAAALLIFIATPGNQPAIMPKLVAVVADADNRPCWLVTEDKARTTLSVAAVWSPPLDAQHALELWVVADNKPIPIGLVPIARDQIARFPIGALPTKGGLMAISLEPPGGSPTGQPTGPVLYQGKILED